MFREATKGAHDEALTPFQRSLENLRTVTEPVTSSLGKLATGIGTALMDAVTDVTSYLTKNARRPATDGLAGGDVLDNFAAGQHHYGLGQVDPRYSSGYDIMTPKGNIDASMKIFMEAMKRASDNRDDTLAYYSGNVPGSAGARKYASAVRGYDIDTLRYLTATGDDQGAALMNFDLSATQQKRQLAESWRDFLGEAYAGNATYLQQASDLEKTLGAERLAIQKQYADKAAEAAKQAADAAAAQAKQDHDRAASSAASVIGSLVDFTRGLSTSSASPLSAEAQYRAANDNFQSTIAAARGGDFDALSHVQGDAQTLLSTGQAVYGSGAEYARVYEQVMAAMREIGTRSAEDLTRAALNQTRDNTASLVDLLHQLIAATEANGITLRDTANATKQSVAEQRQAALRKVV